MNITTNFYRFNSPISSAGLNDSQKKNRLQNSAQNRTVAFKALLPGEQLKSAAKTILDRSIVFGPNEYKSLSEGELSILRDYEKAFREIDGDNIIINDITRFGKMVSDRIHEKYPDGFIFVSVGRSLASCAKYMEFKGEDVKYCPASDLQSGFYRNEKFTPEFVKVYKRYLDSIGLTKELAETTKKNILISDYTFDCEGYTLYNFRKLLSLPEIGICEGETVKYTPVSGMRLFDRKDWIFDYTKDPVYKYHRLKDSWFSIYYKMLANDRMKFHCSVPRFDIEHYMYEHSGYHKRYCTELLDNYYENGNRFEESFETKMMNFIIAESVRKDASKPEEIEVKELPKTLAEQYRDLGRRLECGMIVYNSDTKRTIVSTPSYTAVFNGEIPYQFYHMGKLEHEEYLDYPCEQDKLKKLDKDQKLLFAYPNPECPWQKDAMSRFVRLERA